MKSKAQALLEKLENAGLQNKLGRITFNFLGVDTVVSAKSVVGYVFQDWLEGWLIAQKIPFEVPHNSQEFPDFYLNLEDKKYDMLEVKVFDAEAAPNFDVANFDAYTRSLRTQAYRLDADYLVFSYSLTPEGDFSIHDIWLKKIWEITSPSGAYPLKTQNKQNVIVNIRPTAWFSKKTQYKAFTSRRQFAEAIHKTLLMYPYRKDTSAEWLKEVEANYKLHTGKEL